MSYDLDSKVSIEDILSYKNWRHRLWLPKEKMYTAGYLMMPKEWSFNHLQDRLDNKSFLDVGSNDGYYSFEAEKRGASKVTAADIYYFGKNSNTLGWNREGIELFKRFSNSKINIESLSIYDLDPSLHSHNIVFCANVISWLPDMKKAVECLSNVTMETLYLKDGFLISPDHEPILKDQRNTGTVNFRANLAYIKELLQNNGFKKIETLPIYTYLSSEWQMKEFPSAYSTNEVQIFDLPNNNSNHIISKLNGEWITGSKDEFYFVRKIGWVKKKDVQTKSRFQPSILGKIARVILSPEVLNKRMIRYGNEPLVHSYMIKATK
jgi:tRNA (mo5U34)-methyltransferase